MIIMPRRAPSRGGVLRYLQNAEKACIIYLRIVPRKAWWRHAFAWLRLTYVNLQEQWLQNRSRMPPPGLSLAGQIG